MIFEKLINFENANRYFWMRVMNGYKVDMQKRKAVKARVQWRFRNS